MDVLSYAQRDAEVTFALRRAWEDQYIQVGSKWYVRKEWETYLWERRYWRNVNPWLALEVRKPEPVNMRK